MWFDKYVKGDGNLFSFYYPSRLDITVGGGRSVGCEHLRAGCKAMVKRDGGPADFSYLQSTGVAP